MTSVYERLKNLQITLPDVPPPVVDGYVAAFVPFVRTGNLIYLSGRLAKKNGKLWCGKVGEEITTAQGKQAARSGATEFVNITLWKPRKTQTARVEVSGGLSFFYNEGPWRPTSVVLGSRVAVLQLSATLNGKRHVQRSKNRAAMGNDLSAIWIQHVLSPRWT